MTEKEQPEFTPLGSRLVRACGGRLHDTKAERVAALVLRAKDQQDFGAKLRVQFPALDAEQIEAITTAAAQERGWGG